MDGDGYWEILGMEDVYTAEIFAGVKEEFYPKKGIYTAYDTPLQIHTGYNPINTHTGFRANLFKPRNIVRPIE